MNFIDINRIPFLAKIKNELVETAAKELSEFLSDIPPEQKDKYDKIQATDFIKMYSLPIKFDQEVSCPCSGCSEEIFNFTIDSPEENYNVGKGLKAKEMDELIGSPCEMSHYSFFSKTLDLIPKNIRTGWFFLYKNGTFVDEKEGHGHTTIMMHFLLEDIEEGEFIVHVNKEIKKLSKKGECFIFNGFLPHGAQLSGKSAKFLTLATNFNDLFAV